MVLGGGMGRMPQPRRSSDQAGGKKEQAPTHQPLMTMVMGQAKPYQTISALPKVSEQARAESIQRIMGKHYIGLSELNKIFGTQAVISEKPMPPSITVDMLSSNCPIAGDRQRKIRDTHFLIYLPDKINGENVTLLSFSELVIKIGQKLAGLRCFILGNLTINMSLASGTLPMFLFYLNGYCCQYCFLRRHSISLIASRKKF